MSKKNKSLSGLARVLKFIRIYIIRKITLRMSYINLFYYKRISNIFLKNLMVITHTPQNIKFL